MHTQGLHAHFLTHFLTETNTVFHTYHPDFNDFMIKNVLSKKTKVLGFLSSCVFTFKQSVLRMASAFPFYASFSTIEVFLFLKTNKSLYISQKKQKALKHPKEEIQRDTRKYTIRTREGRKQRRGEGFNCERSQQEQLHTSKLQTFQKKNKTNKI